MDYTKLPRHLIYKDRTDIDDFPVCSKSDFPHMEELYLEALEQRPFIKESYDAPELILRIFNNARYITTLICLENHPNHYLHKYLEKAGSNDRHIIIANHVMPATMALVKNYLCHYMPTLYIDSKIVEGITNNFGTRAWKEMTRSGQDDFYKLVIENSYDPENSSYHPNWLMDPNFKPRDIREIINDPFVTPRDISDNIDYILNSLKENVEIFDEEIAPLNAMYKKVEAWFPSDLDNNLYKELALDKIESRLKELDPNNAYELFNLMNEMEKSLHAGQNIPPKTNKEITQYLKKTLGVHVDEILSAVDDEEIINKEGEGLSETDNQGEGLETIQPIAASSDYVGTTEGAWDDTYDYIFDKRVKPHALFNAMKGINYSNKIKVRRFYYVVYRVLNAINYFSKGTSEHQFLQWINLHFNDSEHRWIDDHEHLYLFRFKLERSAKELKVHPSKWKTIDMYSDLAMIHYNLAIDIKNTFTFVVDKNGEEIKDSESYEHLKDRPQFLSGATWYVDKYLFTEDAYINKG